MQTPQHRLVLGFLVLLALAAGTAQAYPYCQDIMCRVPPIAYCNQQCWYCDGETSGTEYPYPPYCDYPSLTTPGQLGGCACLQASVPNLDPGEVFDLDKLLGRPAATLSPGCEKTTARPAMAAAEGSR